ALPRQPVHRLGPGRERDGAHRRAAQGRAAARAGEDRQGDRRLIAMARALRACVEAGAALLLSACATDLTQARSPCLYEPGGWCGFTRELAEESWQYAQLANNSYKDNEEFAHPPGDFVQAGEPHELESGYAYVVYDRYEPGGETG